MSALTTSQAPTKSSRPLAGIPVFWVHGVLNTIACNKTFGVRSRLMRNNRLFRARTWTIVQKRRSSVRRKKVRVVAMMISRTGRKRRNLSFDTLLLLDVASLSNSSHLPQHLQFVLLSRRSCQFPEAGQLISLRNNIFFRSMGRALRNITTKWNDQSCTSASNRGIKF